VLCVAGIRTEGCVPPPRAASVQGAVKTKIALATGVNDSSAIKQLALWVPGSGDFVVSPSPSCPPL